MSRLGFHYLVRTYSDSKTPYWTVYVRNQVEALWIRRRWTRSVTGKSTGQKVKFKIRPCAPGTTPPITKRHATKLLCYSERFGVEIILYFHSIAQAILVGDSWLTESESNSYKIPLPEWCSKAAKANARVCHYPFNGKRTYSKDRFLVEVKQS